MGLAPQGHQSAIDRQPIECWAVKRREAFETVEGVLFFEDLGVDLERARGGEYPGTAAGRLFGGNGVRRAVGAEKDAGIPQGCDAAHRLPMLLALGDRQTIEMRTDPAG